MLGYETLRDFRVAFLGIMGLLACRKWNVLLTFGLFKDQHAWPAEVRCESFDKLRAPFHFTDACQCLPWPTRASSCYRSLSLVSSSHVPKRSDLGPVLGCPTIEGDKLGIGGAGLPAASPEVTCIITNMFDVDHACVSAYICPGTFWMAS